MTFCHVKFYSLNIGPAISLNQDKLFHFVSNNFAINHFSMAFVISVFSTIISGNSIIYLKNVSNNINGK